LHVTLQELGPLIRTHRLQAGLSIQVVAARAGVDRTLLSRLENQRLPEMGYAKLQRVLAVLELEFAVRPAGGLPTLTDLQRAASRGEE
jgi:transcriptional regulator with XRE-family HTH domain